MNEFEKVSGAFASTFVHCGVGAWSPDMQKITVFMWAAELPNGVRAAAIQQLPDRKIAWILFDSIIDYVGNVASGLAIIVEVIFRDEDGQSHLLTLIGPSGRLKKIFKFLGHPIPKSKKSLGAVMDALERDNLSAAARLQTGDPDAPEQTSVERHREPFFAPTTVVGDYIEEYQRPQLLNKSVLTECPACHGFSHVDHVPWECDECGAWVKHVSWSADSDTAET
jgi:hypothetical protein